MPSRAIVHSGAAGVRSLYRGDRKITWARLPAGPFERQLREGIQGGVWEEALSDLQSGSSTILRWDILGKPLLVTHSDAKPGQELHSRPDTGKKNIPPPRMLWKSLVRGSRLPQIPMRLSSRFRLTFAAKGRHGERTHSPSRAPADQQREGCSQLDWMRRGRSRRSGLLNSDCDGFQRHAGAA
jgi:hypothetical protein